MANLPSQRLRDIISTYSALKQLAGAPSPALLASIAANNYALGSVSKNRPWRPPQWGQDSQAGVSSETTYTRTYVSVQYSDGDYLNYFFDAILSADHTTSREITEHPVQWKAAMADHSYQLPDIVTLEVGMSDSMDSFRFDQQIYYDSNDFKYATDGFGKSVNAYQAFVDLQKSGQPLNLTTHLNSYSNMLIKDIRIRDDYKTRHATKFTITFKQVLIGETGVIEKSLYPAASTGSSNNRAEATKDSDYRISKSILKGIISGNTEGTIFQTPTSLF